MEEYFYEDFTYKKYRQYLERLVEKEYKFIGYREVYTDDSLKQVILRHDVDYSMSGAVNLAKIEKELGIRATYLVFAHSEGYNLFEEKVSEYMRTIISLGHDIGVHVDYGFYYNVLCQKNDRKMLEYSFDKYIRDEIDLVEKTYLCKVTAISFHQPEYRNLMNMDSEEVAGVVNAYSDYISSNFTYCSDSNGYWRFKRLIDVIEEEPAKLHLLFHPIWWTDSVDSPAERVYKYYCNAAKEKWSMYCDDLKRCGRCNVGEEELHIIV